MPEKSHTPSSAHGIAWNLSDLYSAVDDPYIDTDLADVERRCREFAERFRGLFAPERLTAAELLAALGEYESLAEVMSKLGSYSGLITAADTVDPAKRKLEDRVRQSLVERENELTFFELGWLAVPDDVAARVADDPILANYRHYLTSARRYQPHTKSESEE